ncbi:MAG: hypothetical protein M0Z61_01590 [Nitrospiraceae bacterium]|nr:hypothetical protein [Nitrospiraceae bacterium]
MQAYLTQRTAKTLVLLMIAILGISTAAQAQEVRTHVFIFYYGDCCGAAYGICKNVMTEQQAERALGQYFAKHGLRAVIKGQITPHFIKADVFSGKSYVDTVILDMRTGKIRSIY